MKEIGFLFLLLLPALSASTQNNYSQAIEQGDAAFKKGQYKTAINKYFAAESFDPSKKEAVNKWLHTSFSQTKLPLLSFLIVDFMEERALVRVHLMAELAALRQVSLKEVGEQLRFTKGTHGL